MSDDDLDDFYGTPPPPRQSGSNGLLLGLLLAGVIVLVVAVGFASLYSWINEKPKQMVPATATAIDHQPAPAMANEGMRRTYTRAEFATLAMGKTPKEVVAAIGRESDVSFDVGAQRTWHYNGIIRDPADTRIIGGILDFKDGKVVNVRFGI